MEHGNHHGHHGQGEHWASSVRRHTGDSFTMHRAQDGPGTLAWASHRTQGPQRWKGGPRSARRASCTRPAHLGKRATTGQSAVAVAAAAQHSTAQHSTAQQAEDRWLGRWTKKIVAVAVCRYSVCWGRVVQSASKPRACSAPSSVHGTSACRALPPDRLQRPAATLSLG